MFCLYGNTHTHTHSLKEKTQLKGRRGGAPPPLVVVKTADSFSGRTDSMAGDSESKLDNQAENEHVVRQPFLIGVAGGTASGKVGNQVSLPCILGDITDCIVLRL